MASGDLVINLLAKTDRWNSGLNSAQRGLSGFVSSAVSGFAKVGLAMDGLRRVASLIAEPIELARNQIMAEKRLEQVIRSTGGAAGFAADELKKFASQRQEITNFGDEQTIQAAAVLGTFTSIQGEMFKQALVSAQDMSTLLGTDMQSSVIMIGKALNAPVTGITSMTRAGIQFTDQQKLMIKNFVEQGKLAEAQGVILKELQTQFGGQAEAAVSPLLQAKNLWNDMKEEIGKIALDFGPDLLDAVKELKGHMPEIVEAFKTVADATKEMVGAIKTTNDISKKITGSGLFGLAGGNQLEAFNKFSDNFKLRLGSAAPGGRLFGRDNQLSSLPSSGGLAAPRRRESMSLERAKSLMPELPGAMEIFASIGQNALGAIKKEAVNRGLTGERLSEAMFVGPTIDPAILAHRGDAVEKAVEDNRMIGGLEAGSSHAAEVLRNMVGPQEKKQDMQLKESQKQTKQLEKIAKAVENKSSSEFKIGEI